MSAFGYVKTAVLPAAMLMLPTKMDTPEARAMILGIFMQESKCVFRRQIGGPARGFGQFEYGGIRGVLKHQATRPIIEQVLGEMQYGVTADISYAAIEHNDILAVVYARLLLWTDPRPLPRQDQAQVGLQIYLDTWRPGKPRPADWPANFALAWA